MKARENIINTMNRKRAEGLNTLNQPYQVLVVDDSTTMRKIIGQQLKSESYEICGEAANGKQAVELFRSLSPDVVTLDINMPDLDGLATLEIILDLDADARVVMLTSEGEKKTVMQAIGMGAAGYVVKPPNKAKICAMVKRALDR